MDEVKGKEESPKGAKKSQEHIKYEFISHWAHYLLSDIEIVLSKSIAKSYD